jgi:hypothetical protein
MAENTTRDAASFAAGYSPAAGDHPDLESRVVMYRRAVDSGDRRAEAVHARTLMRFVGHLGIAEPTTAGADTGPSKADLQARAAELDLPTSGTKAQLASRIAEAEGDEG